MRTTTVWLMAEDTRQSIVVGFSFSPGSLSSLYFLPRLPLMPIPCWPLTHTLPTPGLLVSSLPQWTTGRPADCLTRRLRPDPWNVLPASPPHWSPCLHQSTNWTSLFPSWVLLPDSKHQLTFIEYFLCTSLCLVPSHALSFWLISYSFEVFLYLQWLHS